MIGTCKVKMDPFNVCNLCEYCITPAQKFNVGIGLQQQCRVIEGCCSRGEECRIVPETIYPIISISDKCVILYDSVEKKIFRVFCENVYDVILKGED